MSKKDIHINYTAADIERYHKKLLTPAEMHALEKAALDDPFLADALEGYAASAVDASTDIANLRKRLADRLQQGAKVIPIATVKKSGYPWLKIAAMIVVLFGAALLVYQFAFNRQETPIAQQSTNEKRPEPTTAAPAESPATDTNTAPATGDREVSSELAAGRDKPAKETATAAAPEPVYFQQSEVAKSKDVTSSTQHDAGIRAMNEATRDSVANTRISDLAAEKTAALKPEGQAPGYSKRNIFRGRVTDASNNPLPFANITNADDNVGTYSDAKGNFVLTSPDSTMDVQIRSLGFMSKNMRLHPDSVPARIALSDDRSSMGAIVLSNKKVSGSRSRNANMTLEEPEPADGWTNYDTYLANNLNVPETYKAKQNSGGEVELSFEVNSLGEPVNITVVRSLCETCDKEAIRLVKEGPRWKRKSKNGRTTVTISF